VVGLLVTLVTFTVIVAVLVAFLVAVTVLPVYVAVEMADTRRFSTMRWFVISAAGVLVGLAAAYDLHRHDVSRLLVLLPVVLTWATPAGLWLLAAGQSRIGGRAGLHE
jgi:hypothetical protein